jgi:hypothetical protein
LGGAKTMIESPYPDWLPELIKFEEFGGNWQKYVDYLFGVFKKDFIYSAPTYDGARVSCRRDPIFDGKYAGFWHCISEGKNENERTPDLRRCERIGWVRPIIENSPEATITIWINRKKSDLRCYLWFNKEYLVVLSKRKKYFLLITAFLTDRKHTVKKLEREYDRCKND